MYVLRVHSLKSMAAVIGAIELSKCAAELEHAGNHEDTGFIKENTPKLLEDYRKYIEYLAPLKEEAEGQGDGEPSEITEDQLKDAYAAIAEFVFCYDDESVDSTIAYLKTFRLPEEAIERIESLESAISLYDWEKLRSLTAEDGGALYG